MGSSFIHLIRTVSNEFFLMAEYYSMVYMYHSFHIHSSADGHWEDLEGLGGEGGGRGDRDGEHM